MPRPRSKRNVPRKSSIHRSQLPLFLQNKLKKLKTLKRTRSAVIDL